MSDRIRESDFIFYRGEDGQTHVQVILGSETVWVTQKAMAEIFDIDVSGINRHINSIINDGEVDEEGNLQKMQIANSDKPVTFYNLEFVTAVGYRVNSSKGIKFRKWARRIINEYLIKGFVLDDERLKQGNKLFGKDYFQELLERVQAIRASEKMFYEKIRDLYATSVDYDSSDPETHKFFAKVQNKVEYAIVKRTSAETIRLKANATLPNMGLQTWKNAKKDGNILKLDVTVAKNYFTQEEIKQLNSLINMYLDYAKLQIERNRLMKMRDWEQRLDAFLSFNEFPILSDYGSIKKEIADKFAENEFSKFKKFKEKDGLGISKFTSVAEDITSTGNLPKESDFFFDKKNKPSDFDKKIATALNFNNNASKSKRSVKKCPKCGFFVDRNLNYCNNDIVDENGDVVACGYSFGAIDGKEAWDGM